MSASGGGSVMSDDDDDLEQRPPTYCPPEFIEPEEAQRRAVSLIRALGRETMPCSLRKRLARAIRPARGVF